jgi:hypothetical protein
MVVFHRSSNESVAVFCCHVYLISERFNAFIGYIIFIIVILKFSSAAQLISHIDAEFEK